MSQRPSLDSGSDAPPELLPQSPGSGRPAPGLQAPLTRSTTIRTRGGASMQQAALWLLLLGYLVVGVFGRFPWKADEPYSVGIVVKMLEEGEWLVPRIADQPFLEKPPFVYWLGALSAKLFSLLPPHEASKIALLLLMAATMFALLVGARLLRPEAICWRGTLWATPADTVSSLDHFASPTGYGLLAALLFAGTLGFAEHVHKLTADIGQLAGCTMALVGLVSLGSAASPVRTDLLRRPEWTGVLIGSGIGIGFMSKGLLVPGMIALTWLLCLTLPSYRGAAARRGAVVALATSLPWLLIWPLLLLRASPPLFDEWFWDHNVGRFLGHVDLGGTGLSWSNKIAALALASFPALPLTLAGLVLTLRRTGRSRRWLWMRGGGVPGHTCLLVFALVSLTTLFASASFRDNYLLPVLPALVLLALPVLTIADRAVAAGWNRAANLVFGGMAAAVVLVWLHLVGAGVLLPEWFKAIVGAVLPLPHVLAFDLVSVLVAMSALGLWSFANASGHLRGVVAPWCAGIAMLWTVVFSLLLPWIDSARSYDGVFSDLSRHLVDSDCLATAELGESELAMLEYVTGVEAVRIYLGRSGAGDPSRPNPAAAACNQLLVLSRGRHSYSPEGAGWKSLWTGARPGDARERFELFRRVDGSSAASR